MVLLSSATILSDLSLNVSKLNYSNVVSSDNIMIACANAAGFTVAAC